MSSPFNKIEVPSEIFVNPFLVKPFRLQLRKDFYVKALHHLGASFPEVETRRSRKDLGLVPLIYVWSEYMLSKSFRLVFELDGLVAPQGRAIDTALMAGYMFSPSSSLNLGYRVLEGGVDNDKVFNFSQFNFMFLSADIMF